MAKRIEEITVGKHTFRRGDRVVPPQVKADYHENDRDRARVVNSLYQQGESVVIDDIFDKGATVALVCRDYCVRARASALQPASVPKPEADVPPADKDPEEQI